jgi:hypothetical protein
MLNVKAATSDFLTVLLEDTRSRFVAVQIKRALRSFGLDGVRVVEDLCSAICSRCLEVAGRVRVWVGVSV